jgi:hypothetical protein
MVESPVANVYAHVWQQAMSGAFANAACYVNLAAAQVLGSRVRLHLAAAFFTPFPVGDSLLVDLVQIHFRTH